MVAPMLHRYCAGVPTQVYKSLTAKGVPFSCFACSLLNHREQIDALKSTVKSLRDEIAELKSSYKSSSSPAQKANPQVTTSPSVSRDDGNPLPVSSYLHERKYNIILYGLDECLKGSSRSTRLEGDLNKALTVLCKFDQSIGSHAIKDIYRLGRFSPTIRKPRPLLVKFIRVADAIRILSMRGSVNVTPIIVKPDMSPHERKNEYILLKERWSLIQSDVPRRDIKIRGHRLLVRNKLHGQATMTGHIQLPQTSFCQL